MFLDEFDHIIKISIHALREEGDAIFVDVHQYEEISIHALREEGDWTTHLRSNTPSGFLSTPSARRATSYECLKLLAETFLSTPSARRATRLCRRRRNPGDISIHALREEGDTERPAGRA